MSDERVYSGVGNLMAADGSVVIHVKVAGEKEPVPVNIGEGRAYNLTGRQNYITVKNGQRLGGTISVTGCIEVRTALQRAALERGMFVLRGPDGFELPLFFRGFVGPWGFISPAGRLKPPQSES
jgi:hypothetical protein